ncbi:hypothetical protein D1BOALGB6SA_563 [Olavius sp. associated proteobacterium Delta 1]|nr:hypothetical protein D1BOALGB6SA_563 [Olavius sp. associated proteobacterium Delta 1]
MRFYRKMSNNSLYQFVTVRTPAKKKLWVALDGSIIPLVEELFSGVPTVRIKSQWL